MPSCYCRLAAVGVALLVLLCIPARSGAQVQPSQRILSLGEEFDGFIDDVVTDAARNPARLAGFRGPAVYTGLTRGRVPGIQFPRVLTGATVPSESYSLFGADRFQVTRGFDVTGLTAVGTPGGWTASATVFGRADGRDDANTRSTVYEDDYPWPDMIQTYEEGSARRDELDFGGVDLAVSTSRDADANALGARLRATYLSDEYTRIDSYSYMGFRATAPGQRTSTFDLRRSTDRYEEIDARLVVGWFRPRGLVREATVSLEAGRVQLDFKNVRQVIQDDDVDGDGSDPGGSPVNYDYRLEDARSRRDYDRAGVGAAVLFEHGARVRSYHAVRYARLEGDGVMAQTIERIERFGNTVEEELAEGGYAHDGATDRVIASSAVGIVEEVVDGVLVAGAVTGSYRRDEFDEDGVGDASVARDGVSFDSPIAQRISLVEEAVSVTVSLGAEWTPVDALAIRVGLRHYAGRLETDVASSVRVSEYSSAFGVDDAVTGVLNKLSYSESSDLSLGVGLRLADRLVVDAGGNREFGVASVSDFYYVTALFYF